MSNSKDQGLPSPVSSRDAGTGSKVLALQRQVEECVMSIGRVMADQVCASAALEQEKLKLRNLRERMRRNPTRDAATQTDNNDSTKEREQLLKRRAQLLNDIRDMPMNSASMVDILKKRNAALLIREERALQNARKLRQEKQDRLNQLKRKQHLGSD